MGLSRLLLLAYSFLFLASSARAGESEESTVMAESVAAPAAAPESSPPVVVAPAGPALAPSGKLDFDFFGAEDATSSGLKAPLAAPDPDFEARVHRRRWMLKTHQALGMTTWALMAATVTVGQLNYNQLYGGGGGSTKWMGLHTILVIATSTAFLGAGTLAILAPKPYAKPLRFDPGLVHRIAAAGAALGMVTQIGLGIFTHLRAQAGNPHDRQTLARTHQIVGYSTFGLLTIAGTAWIF